VRVESLVRACESRSQPFHKTMADSAAAAEAPSETVTVLQEEVVVPPAEPTVVLRLRKPRTSREVHWAQDTVDNEGLGKKKSKCCCIYEKPKTFGESSSESDDECEHCRGHVEKKKKNKRHKHSDEPENLEEPTGDVPCNGP